MKSACLAICGIDGTRSVQLHKTPGFKKKELQWHKTIDIKGDR